MKETVIMIMPFAATAITVCIAVTKMYINRVKALQEEFEKQHKLKEFEKRRMCNSFCKFKEAAKTIEELEWQCANCPIAKL